MVLYEISKKKAVAGLLGTLGLAGAAYGVKKAAESNEEIAKLVKDIEEKLSILLSKIKDNE